VLLLLLPLLLLILLLLLQGPDGCFSRLPGELNNGMGNQNGLVLQ
jgi:hypothetical protein